ncbi:hypothetical protein D3C78_1145460 [compost metagenome]
MLVSFVNAIPREVFNRYRHAMLLNRFGVRLAHASYSLRIRTECSNIGYRITEIIVDIENGCESPVTAYSTTLPRGNDTKFTSHFGVIRRRHLQLLAEESTLCRRTITSCFKISCN